MTCSGTGWWCGVDGPLWVPGTRRLQMCRGESKGPPPPSTPPLPLPYYKAARPSPVYGRGGDVLDKSALYAPLYFPGIFAYVSHSPAESEGGNMDFATALP